MVFVAMVLATWIGGSAALAVGDVMEPGTGTRSLGDVGQRGEERRPSSRPGATVDRPSDPDQDPPGQPFDDTVTHDPDRQGSSAPALAPGTQVPHPSHTGEPEPDGRRWPETGTR